MSISAGEIPASSNGAPGPAKNAPQALRLLKPSVSDMIARPMRTAATTSIVTEGSPLSDRRVKLSANTAIAIANTIQNTGRQPTRVPRVPPMRNALTPARARADPSEPIAVACWSPL